MYGYGYAPRSSREIFAIHNAPATAKAWKKTNVIKLPFNPLNIDIRIILFSIYTI